ncbi:hypothetical protein ACFWM3_01020 [Gottfriedia sp. NPDC058432]|uniref:hypothetical protein n=1 Tax=Gottfriedia sp. NPDC058432 TaxID=3346497 RepID=UPI0036541A03
MKTLNKGITKHITENNAKHVNSQSSLPAPPILQGRAVNDKYPQMPAPTVEGFSNEDGTDGSVSAYIKKVGKDQAKKCLQKL